MPPFSPALCACERSSLEHIIGDSVRAMKPDTTTDPARVKANSLNSAPEMPGHETDRRIDRRQRDGHGDDRQRDFARPDQRRLLGGQPSSIWR